MIAIICLLIVIVLANILTHYIQNPVFLVGVSFINENFWLLLLIAVVLFIGAMFRVFPFPLNLPAPIIQAIGSVFCIAFLLRVFQWIDPVTLYPLFWYLSFIFVPLVFLIVLASGYYGIFHQIWWQPRPDNSYGLPGQVVHETLDQASPGTMAPDVKSWEEIGVEFRLMLYDVIHRFRQEIQRKP
jgi:hypothetical protein